MSDSANEFYYEGVCPLCKEADAMLNVGRDHWGVCHLHRHRWLVGSNLFDYWRHENESIWDRNKAILATYQEVEPFYGTPPPPMTPENVIDFPPPF